MFHFNLSGVKSFDIFRNTQNSLFATYDVSRCEARSQWKYEYYISLVLLILNGTARNEVGNIGILVLRRDCKNWMGEFQKIKYPSEISESLISRKIQL